MALEKDEAWSTHQLRLQKHDDLATSGGQNEEIILKSISDLQDRIPTMAAMLHEANDISRPDEQRQRHMEQRQSDMEATLNAIQVTMSGIATGQGQLLARQGQFSERLATLEDQEA